jgi:carbon-monoxide dehydrogenase large subunit
LAEIPHRYGSSRASPRSEDRPLITGGGRYTDDVAIPDQAYAAFVRAPLGHANLRGVDTAAALNHPGVLAVLTGADVKAAGMGGLVPSIPSKGRDGKPMFAAPQYPLAQEKVRYVGEAVALVIAASSLAAQDAAELVSVDYEELPAAATLERAMAPDAPRIWDDAPGNLALDWEDGDAAASARAFASAAHVERVRLLDTRVAPSAMEPRAALASFDAASGRYTLVASTQGVAIVRQMLATQFFRLPVERFRVLTYDVGGGFGMKALTYPDYAALLLAAQKTGRPVKWCATRLESFLCDTHGRDGIIEGEMAFGPGARITGVRMHIRVGTGAGPTTFAPAFTTHNTKNCLSSVYAIPSIHMRAQVVLTNAAPLGPYRGAGRPEAIYMIERLLDQAAGPLGLDRVEIRRRNLIPAGAMPYAAPNGQTYDSGEFEAVLDKALIAADWAGFPARRAAAEQKGRLRGIGLGCFLEVAGGMLDEVADLRFSADGYVELYLGSQAIGQGHLSTFPPLAAARLGVDVARVRLVQGDSDAVPAGTPTVASRSVMMVGSALALACDEAIARGKLVAEQIFEAAAADIEFSDGHYRVCGTDLKMPILDLAVAAKTMPGLPQQLAAGLDNKSKFTSPAMTYPNGCHVCEVEIDPETGAVAVAAYTAVDDVGTMLNETIVEGQIHGGVVQGLGQVLGEEVVYDPDGQLLTASFMDYRMPRAADIPAIKVIHHSVPSTTNPLGVKGAGESGVAGALPAATSAVLDALRSHGISKLDLPFTAHRVWQALRARQ